MVGVGFIRRGTCGGVFSGKCRMSSVVGGVSLLGPATAFAPNAAVFFFSRLRRYPAYTATLGFFGVSNHCSIVYSNSLVNVGCRRVRSGDINCGRSCRVRSVSFRRFL